METVITVLGVLMLGIFAFTAFGLTITKKDMDDLDSLKWFVDKCQVTPENGDYVREELQRLTERGLIPEEEINELALAIRREFKA